MWERFGRRRRRTRRSEAVGQAMLALGNARRRFGPSSRTGRGRGANGNAVGAGIGVLAIAGMAVLAFWLLRRRARGTASVIPEPEEGLEAQPLAEEDVAPPGGAPSAEDVFPREEPPPGEERPERRGATSTTPPTPREEPPSGEERPER